MDRIRIIDDPLSIETEDTERRFSTPPRILQIGTSHNKNVPTLLAALSEIDCTLHLVGPMTDSVRAALRANGVHYKHDENLSENEILNAYRSADIVTFCSTSEGFGLPIIEAQALAIPVVTSNIAPMNAVAGSGALFVDPFDVLSIREGIRRLIADEGLRDRLRAEGRQNVLRFSPSKIAQQYLDVYRDVAKIGSVTEA